MSTRLGGVFRVDINFSLQHFLHLIFPGEQRAERIWVDKAGPFVLDYLLLHPEV